MQPQIAVQQRSPQVPSISSLFPGEHIKRHRATSFSAVRNAKASAAAYGEHVSTPLAASAGKQPEHESDSKPTDVPLLGRLKTWSFWFRDRGLVRAYAVVLLVFVVARALIDHSELHDFFWNDGHREMWQTTNLEAIGLNFLMKYFRPQFLYTIASCIILKEIYISVVFHEDLGLDHATMLGPKDVAAIDYAFEHFAQPIRAKAALMKLHAPRPPCSWRLVWGLILLGMVTRRWGNPDETMAAALPYNPPNMENADNAKAGPLQLIPATPAPKAPVPAIPSGWEMVPVPTLKYLIQAYNLGQLARTKRQHLIALLEQNLIPATLAQGWLLPPGWQLQAAQFPNAMPWSFLSSTSGAPSPATPSTPQLPPLPARNSGELCLSELPKQQEEEPFEDYAEGLRCMLTIDNVTLDMKVRCLLHNTRPEIQASVAILFRKGHIEFKALATALARAYPTPHLDRLDQFLQAQPNPGESFVNFGERLEHTFNLFTGATPDKPISADNIRQKMLINQLLTSVSDKLRIKLREQWSNDRNLTWEKAVEEAEKFRLHNHATARPAAKPVAEAKSTSSKQTSGNRPNLPPKQWCKGHQRNVRHSPQNCRILL
ncbi:unnamed protein product [Notodromas monacha]|uniref:Uncharacterized protein n=1 Tax=Notodromas monacha TaxID=399045 RepID=A0A7R9BY87_9CRUS|nr:unnamed protein product [Notodromas monacha]CAG0922876.1 unnamed protein product [Notodromas monacha]